MANRLAQETSPYLLQHADNPVDWHPWGEEALTLARSLDKPILLSVGYSACHWCHVMAHESFEDPQVASVMNELFVNVKVDREERPDIDQIYQNAHAMLTRRNGGWPLTMFLMPDQTPFFGGTYFPKSARHGMPGFPDLLARVAGAYRGQRTDIEQQSEALRAALAQTLSAAPSGGELSAAPLDRALQELKRIFDPVDGGIGTAPKFPHPAELGFCLQRAVATCDDDALAQVKLTLTKMAEGGIFDQLGGGFCRYSVDAHWTIPHFEKMLYDNGPLLALYSDVWLIDRQPVYERTAAATAAWLMREMQAPEGGYYSSLDADSEHEEGKFYVWTRDDAQRALTREEYAVLAPHYGLDAPPNFEHRHWHLRVAKPLPAVAAQLGVDLEHAQRLLDAARAKLLSLRERRVRPGRDDKVLTSWNALAIRGMARAGRVFAQPEWIASARAAADFTRRMLWRERDGGRKRLLATCKGMHAHLNAYLDDYAFLLDALLELMQADFDREDLNWARELAEVLLDQFEDRAGGGFFFVSHDHERLIHRVKNGHDNATPAGNGIAASVLQRLGHLIGEPRYLDAAERALKAFKSGLDRHASAHASLCIALEDYVAPPSIVILRGDRAAMTEWKRTLDALYVPRATVIALPAGLAGLPPALDKRVEGLPAGVNAWVCQGVTCLPPIADLEELIATVTQRAG